MTARRLKTPISLKGKSLKRLTQNTKRKTVHNIKKELENEPNKKSNIRSKKEDGIPNTSTDEYIYQSAVKKLQLNSIPSILPCREVEFGEVFNFIAASIQTSSSGQALYISGVPGTGKTATVLSAIKKADQTFNNNDINFQCLKVNALELSNPVCIYQELYRQLFKKKAPNSSRSYDAIDYWLTSSPELRPATLLVIDELDKLVTPRQHVLYNIFEWPHRRMSKFIVIGISNLIDLPDKLLPRIRSRLGFGRLMFIPYRTEQIRRILVERLSDLGHYSSGSPLIDNIAIKLCAQRVATLSGDIRAALRTISRAMDICKPGISVSVSDVASASREFCDSTIYNTVKSLPNSHRLILTCILVEKSELRKSGLVWPSLIHCMLRYNNMLTSKGKTNSFEISHFSIVLDRLISLNLASKDFFLPQLDNTAKNKEAKFGFNQSIDTINNNNKRTKNPYSLDPIVDEEQGSVIVIIPDDIEEEIRHALSFDPSLEALLHS